MMKMINYQLTTEQELEIFATEINNIFSNEELKTIARECGFLKRESPLTPKDFLYLCTCGDQNIAMDTLVNLCSNLDANTGTLITPQALHERFSESSVAFLKAIWTHIIKGNLIKSYHLPTDYDNHFDRIRILDSMAYQIPDQYAYKYIGAGGCAHTAGIKCQVEFDLKSGEFLNVEVGEGRSSDSKYGEQLADTIRPKDLVLRDLGYFKLENFNIINEKGAFYISRLKSNTSIYIKNPNPEYHKNGTIKKSTMYQVLDISSIMDEIKEGETIELTEAYVGKCKISTRLIIHKLTKAQKQKRLLDLKNKEKKKGMVYSEHAHSVVGINIYMTNIDASVLDKEQVHNIYTLRWQIEILFKSFKTYFEIDEVKKVKIERFECQLYGKLIAIILTSSVMFRLRALLMIKKEKEISELKATGILKQYLNRIFASFMDNLEKLTVLLHQIFKAIEKNGCKSRSKHKKTAFEILAVNSNFK